MTRQVTQKCDFQVFVLSSFSVHILVSRYLKFFSALQKPFLLSHLFMHSPESFPFSLVLLFLLFFFLSFLKLPLLLDLLSLFSDLISTNFRFESIFGEIVISQSDNLFSNIERNVEAFDLFPINILVMAFQENQEFLSALLFCFALQDTLLVQ